MASSYASPNIPTAPTTTPVSVRARLRAPIHNPYDKFTGNDFNAWIGDLTSKIRRVLAHEEPVVEKASSSGSAGDVSAYDDGPMEDSFAEVKARRAAKGKGRADPGDVQDEDVVESIVASDDLEEHELQEVYEYGEEDYSDEEAFTQKGLPETIELSSDEDEEPTGHRLSSPGIEYEEDESAEEEDYHHEPLDGADVDDELQPESDEVEDDFPPRTQHYNAPPVDISDPWVGPSTFAEDFYSGGDLPQSALLIGDPHVLSTEELDPLDEQFPPAPSPAQPVELADPWIGPQTYAEDFYNGGDVLGEPSALNPSHLTPMATTPRDDDDIGMVLTPGVVSPTPSVESPRRAYNIDELEDESKVQPSQIHAREQSGEATDEVPTFSMPLMKEAQEADADHPTSPIAYEEALDSEREEDAIEPSQSVPLRDSSVSPSHIATSRHVDWNYPPAFPGRVASSAGHLNIPPDESVAARVDRAHSPEVLEISDDEEDATAELEKSDDFNSGDITLGEVTVPTVADEELERDTSPGEAAIGISPITSTAKEAGDYDFETFETLYLATDFHQLDQDPSTAESTSLDELFEPICVQSADFGDLPINTPPAEGGRDAFSPELLSIFEQFQKPDGLTEETDISKGQEDDTDKTAPLRPLETSNAEKVVPAPLTVEDDEVPEVMNAEQHTHQDYPEDAAVRKNGDNSPHSHPLENVEVHEDDVVSDGVSQFAAYEVLEIDVSEEVAADKETTVDFDVMTDLGDGSVFELDYTVEEMMTEGRRTLEPEEYKGDTASDPITQPEHVEEVDHVEMAILPPTPPDAVSPSGTDGNEILVSDSLEEEHVQADDMHTEDPLSLTTDLSTESFVSHEHQSTFAGGIPMPVSADPTVPDPASMHTTPLSPQSPVETMEDNGANEGTSSGGERERQRAAASAIPPSLLKHLSGHKSISGLFTPLTETDSSPEQSVRSSEHSEDEAAPGQLLGDAGNAPVEDAPIDNAPDVVVAEDNNASATTVPEAVDHPAADAISGVPTSTSAPAIEALPEALGTPHAGDQRENDGGEADADGDVDSDYDIRSSRERSLPPQAEESQEHTATEDSPPEDSQGPAESAELIANEETPPIIPNDTAPETAQTAPLASSDVLSPTDIPGLGSTQEESVPELSLPAAVETEETQPAVQRQFGDVDKLASTAETPAVADPSEPRVEPGSSEPHSPESTTEDSRPLKRKRREPTPVPQRMTRSMSTKGPPVPPEAPVKRVSKGKGKAKADDVPADDDDAVSVALSSLSEAAPSNLDTISEYPDSSRSGSVVSSEPPYTADSSPLAAYPPTSARQNMQAVFGLIHAHGLLHHHHGRALPGFQAPAHVPTKEPSPQRDVSPSSTREAPQESDSIEGPSSPVTPTTTSPVTRSNCRFHKISLPKEEDGPRVFFVVPGCSLSDKELMDDEEIQDHGPAQAEEQAWLIPDIESLDLSSYLLGVLRQLVGVDLLREQEIFYLAQPGEKPRFKGKRRVKHRVQESISGRNSFGPQVSKKSAATRKRRSTANTDSISASGSTARRQQTRRSASTSVSVSDNEMEGEEPKPKAKRRKADAVTDTSISAGTPEAESSRPAAQPKARRGKRLGTDAAEYKPNPSALEESEVESEATTSRKRRATRSRKRPRGDDATQNEPASEAATKKRKISSTDGGDPEDPVSSQPQSESV